jgi:eukaryotic-like serine/threonine-protein kinase
MTLEPGRTLSHFRHVEKIGEGGMGVVWRAADSTLGRDVALKLLPPAFASDPERLARFEREARLLASLNHPNIASIYGLDSADGERFLAMEFVEGESLASRLTRGPIPIEESLAIARQIAEALEAAHEKGIVHRDLKPANVMLTAGERVKLLDFGLARAFEGDVASGSSARLSQSPTITAAMTSANVILGTAAYMSPEQARGQVVDKRADVWAFGVVLYEMLTGRQMFEGDTITDTLASVLKSDPDWAALPAGTPPRVRALLARCLERSPRARLRDIGEARIALEQAMVGAGEDSGAESAPSSAMPPRQGVRPLIFAGARLALGLAAALVAQRLMSAPRDAGPLRRFMVGASADPATTPSAPCLSPDGRALAYLSAGKVWVQELSEGEPRPVATDPAAKWLFWSPASRQVAYLSGSRVMKVAMEGGEPQNICDARAPFTNGSGATWTDAGTIVCTRGVGRHARVLGTRR